MAEWFDKLKNAVMANLMTMKKIMTNTMIMTIMTNLKRAVR